MKDFPDIPWVADFRDEWTNNALLKHTTICHIELKGKMLERQVFEFADAIVINTQLCAITQSGQP